jgi:hypothetical protein
VKSLLYASASALSPRDEQRELDRIVSVARERNARLGVTGTLVYTRSSFAQILEGPDDAVDAIMAKIARDPRHDKVTVVDVQRPSERIFGGWSLAYAGGSRYVDKHIAPLIHGGGGDEARLLRQLMKALAHEA